VAMKGELDITKNLKMVEWLKAEIVQSMGALFKSLINASAEATADALAAIIILIYLLGSRVGVPFSALDREVRHKLKQSLADAPAEDRWHQDISALADYLRYKTR
jgi:uncharacterized membrane protein YcfT